MEANRQNAGKYLKNINQAETKKKPHSFERGFYNLRRRHTLPKVTSVPSAQLGLTSLFGMGRGGHQR